MGSRQEVGDQAHTEVPAHLRAGIQALAADLDRVTAGLGVHFGVHDR